jgi:hypothetical protein
VKKIAPQGSFRANIVVDTAKGSVSQDNKERYSPALVIFFLLPPWNSILFSDLLKGKIPYPLGGGNEGKENK